MSEELKLTGEIIAILPEVTGTSGAGKNWVKKDFVIEYGDQYKKNLALTLFGDKTTLIDKYGVGDTIEVKFNVESKEHNSKWFTNVGCWFISGEAKAKSGSGLPPSEMAMSGKQQPEDDGKDELPF